MSEAKPQDGSTVKGYRKLSDAEIAAMNRLKELSRNFIRELRDIQLDLLPQDPVLSDRTAAYRSASLATTKMQEACMWGCRSVARPDGDC
ncbi:Acb2/Tad1 domain-containing protein [Klebsiella quasipneumoniae]|uniref:Acb2/Tad1 domain-containing protein n=1 Tax=Klebsiella quasipneumoniae TaxID=1463165 RepID=UPI00083F5E90|nr:hypothetical protein [Klebsiella quasipneumoniae]